MRDGADLAGIFYTGGTTGRSKGVMLSHGNLMANALNALGEGLFAGHAVYLHAAPMFHLANGAAMYSILLSGGSNVIIPGFTPEGVDGGDAERARHRRAAGADHDPDVRRSSSRSAAYDLSSCRKHRLRRLADQRSRARSRHEGVAQRAVHPGLRHDRTGADRDAAALEGAYRRAAAPRTAIVSPAAPRSAARSRSSTADDKPVPCGTVGEIVVRGDNVMMGYWERPEETARAIVDGWMHTGDGGYMDEHGFVYVVDRVKDMIISGGENVYSAEVENALAQHPAVAQCAVIGIPSEQWGEQVHAVVVSKARCRCRRGELIAFCKSDRRVQMPASRRDTQASRCRCRAPERYSSASCASRTGKTGSAW